MGSLLEGAAHPSRVGHGVGFEALILTSAVRVQRDECLSLGLLSLSETVQEVVPLTFRVSLPTSTLLPSMVRG